MGFFDFMFEGGIPRIGVLEASKKADAGVSFLDIRELFEWNKGHAVGAVHVPMSSLLKYMEDVDKDAEVMLICTNGQRALTATKRLIEAGWQNVVAVHGGLQSWKAAGCPMA